MSGRVPTVAAVAAEETASTNADALALVRSGERCPPFWVTAKRQTAGRGRDGRVWVSLPGNVHASLAVPLDCEVRIAPQVSLVAGVGVFDALSGLTGLSGGRCVPRSGELRLKWPNDILIGSAKCGGVLVQTTADPADRLVAVVGIGLNVAAYPLTGEREATGLIAEGFDVNADEVFSRVASAMDAALQVWDFGRGFEAIRARWLAAGTPIGTAMSVNSGAGVTAGWFAGLDEDGALLMRDTHGVAQRITFGDVLL